MIIIISYYSAVSCAKLQYSNLTNATCYWVLCGHSAGNGSA